MHEIITWSVDDNGILRIYLGNKSMIEISDCGNMSDDSVVELINEQIEANEWTRCNNCDKIFVDDNALVLLRLEEDGELVRCCDVCKTDAYLMQPFTIQK